MTNTSVAAKSERSPRVVERRNRDDAVMAAAIEIMAKHGYAGTSIQEVADKVGVLKGSLYHYFSSKEELLFRILEESHTESRQIAEAVASLDLEPIEELSEYLRRSAVWYLENRDRATIYFNEAKHLTGDRRNTMRSHGKAFEQQISRLVAASLERGQIDSPIDAALITHYLLGAMNSLPSWRTKSTQFKNSEVAEAFVELTRHAIGARDPE